MARDRNNTKRTRNIVDEISKMTAEELIADLELDTLSYADCVRELFDELYAELYGDMNPEPAPPPEYGGGRVVQIGPGWRTPPKEKD